MKPPTHKVVLHSEAIDDLQQLYGFVYENAPNQTTEWAKRLLRKAKTLERMPDRCPIARESKRVFLELRQLLFGRRPDVLRILFTIDGDVVRVLKIVRASKRSPTKQSIQRSYFHE